MGFAEAMVTDEGRVALAGLVYALVALLKLIPWVRSQAPLAKLATGALLGIAGGASAWAAGAALGASAITAGAAFLGAIGLHESIGKLVELVLPFVALRAPGLAAVLRPLFAPSVSADVLAAEVGLRRVAGGAP